MLVITIIELFLIILFGIRISYTDISTHKAYNKDVLAFFSVALLLQIVSAVIDHKIISVAIINIILTILLSVVFYTTKIWAAGDAKSYITIITLFPSYLYINSYGDLFPSFYILGYTFSLALLYVLLESITKK